MPLSRLVLLFAVLLLSTGALAGMTLASGGKARCVIVVQAAANETERYAAQELADYLQKVTGATFRLTQLEPPADEPAIVVGPGTVAATRFAEFNLASFGGEQLAIKLKNKRLLIGGGRPRGTLYAVYRFLYTQCGIRWWTPWATHIPKKRDMSVGDLNIQEKPAFEARDPFWFAAFDGDWAARNYSNSEHARLESKHGGKVTYKGFVHTVTGLVPPETYFATHPEWFAMRDGKRLGAGWTQLCLSNPELPDFIVEQVRNWLKESPDANIVSISQNDSYANCQCPECKAADEAEGSPAGLMVKLVNYVAAKLGPDYPNVAFDTLAYQYTRKAPKTVRPLPNVIIRLCSIECNFAEPLTGPSNKAFMDDIVAWGKICDRVYVWDYTTNFSHYVQPHPNWFVEGPNIRFFRDHNVKGLFPEGAYQSNGSEMAELRAWVEAQLMWDPDQDDKKLIDEFLVGYYGKAAAKPIREYMDLLSKEAQGYYMGCYSGPEAPFLRFEVMAKAERLWQKAEAAAAKNPDLYWRVRMGHLPLYYVWLSRWTSLRRECIKTEGKWPVDLSRKAVAEAFRTVYTSEKPAGWKGVTVINEGSLKPEDFLARFKEDVADPVIPKLPNRKRNVDAPADLGSVNKRECVDGQDDVAELGRDGEWTEMRPDPWASDGIAVWMPSTHVEWAFSVPFKNLPEKARSGKWKVYVVVRCEKGEATEGTMFSAGVYDTKAGNEAAHIEVSVADATSSYKSYLVGTVNGATDRYVWVAPAKAKGAKAVWVDRVYLVPEK